jgi:hypothetical protein
VGDEEKLMLSNVKLLMGELEEYVSAPEVDANFNDAPSSVAMAVLPRD